MSLLAAIKNISNGRVTERDFRQMQEMAIQNISRTMSRPASCARASKFKIEKEQKDKIEEAINKMFDEYVEKLKKDLRSSRRPRSIPS